MKNAFKEFNLLTPNEIKSLWDTSIFIFDTNILLNLYRYSEETSSEFIKTIEKLDKVWIPYQVGWEFHNKRLSIVSEQKKIYLEFLTKISEIIKEIENKNRNPFLSKESLLSLISVQNDIKSEIGSKIKNYDDLINQDKILDKINIIFNGKVGKEIDEKTMDSICKEGDIRYKDNIPPGYKDKDKSHNKKFGDLIIWKEIIKKAKSESVDVVFISDDRKEDWWLEHQGKTISPRPELLKEFYNETKRNCHFYKPFQFLEFANEYSENNIKIEVIEEVKNYDVEKDKKDEYIFIEYTLKGEEKYINILFQDIRSTGYNLFIEEPQKEDIYRITIIIPNINDLERRLNERYLYNINKYKIEILNNKKR